MVSPPGFWRSRFRYHSDRLLPIRSPCAGGLIGLQSSLCFFPLRTKQDFPLFKLRIKKRQTRRAKVLVSLHCEAVRQSVRSPSGRIVFALKFG